MQKKRFLFILWIAAGLLIWSGCAPGAISEDLTPMPSEPETFPSGTAVPPAAAKPTLTVTSEPEPTAAVDIIAGCPSENEEGKLYIDRANGFCLLYPADFETQSYREFEYDRTRFLGPLLEANAMETLRVILTIESNGPAQEMGVSQYAQRWIDLFASGLELEQDTAVLGGQQAVVYSGLPAFGPGEQSAFVVASNMKYRIALSPQIGSVPDLDKQAQQAWQMVTSTIVFFQPQEERQYTGPEDACPQADGAYRQYINFTNGYCLLYPDDFEQTPDFPGELVGGPILDSTTSWGEVRASLTVGALGHFPDKTLMDVLEPRRQFIDESSIQQTTIAGYPALTFRDPRGPWASRQAMILVDGFVYTIVNQPWEPERYPEGMPYLDRIWETVSGSLAFFTPWR